jgi:uncharacterized protein (UPF0332 family)
MSPTRYLEKAERALGGAELLLQVGEIEGACNRAYYAMYDAAHAALLAVSSVDFKTTKTHRGLIAAFGHQPGQSHLNGMPCTEGNCNALEPSHVAP